MRHEYDLAATLAGLTDDDLTLVAQNSRAASSLQLSLLSRSQHRNLG